MMDFYDHSLFALLISMVFIPTVLKMRGSVLVINVLK